MTRLSTEPRPAGSSGPPRRRDSAPCKVAKIVANVYNLVNPDSNSRMDWIGMGLFHCGIEIYGKEWSYGGWHNAPEHAPDVCGIFHLPPRTAMPPQQFHKAIELGETVLSEEQVRFLLRSMEPEWTAKTYNILGRNCNHFCEDFVRRLGAASRCTYTFPQWVNRAARTGDMFIPSVLLDYILKQLPEPPHPVRGAAACVDATEVEQHVIPPGDELPRLSVRQLRTLMFVHRIDYSDCVEKQEMLQRLEAFRKARDKAPSSS
eukprot:TRINITY_DN22981_c0_g1_i1.p1 TRINITY_DN22981_c0_g1~~TRINITY_DN22981_c0_g1_i1.p1  ORF type:complete len:261 (+),score=72.06 TRINITY_DN22981_c0_g1_i1:89-871(+)